MKKKKKKCGSRVLKEAAITTHECMCSIAVLLGRVENEGDPL